MPCTPARSAFAFLKFIDMAPRELNDFHSSSTIARQIRSLQVGRRSIEFEPFKEYISCFTLKEFFINHFIGTYCSSRMLPPTPFPFLRLTIYETFVVAKTSPTLARSPP